MPRTFISFDVKTGIKNIIGRDLITDDFIAIYELVKNSYDAYADHVTLTFNSDEIIISDNGKGMSKKDLELKWFAVAYSAKKDGSEDSFPNEDDEKRESHLNNLKSRRFYAGAKGVGRFSCDRLGNKLVLITQKSGARSLFKVDVDWSKFERNAKQSFGDIKIPLNATKQQVVFPGGKHHGTFLKITKLNSDWSEEKLTELKRSLEKLINPFSKDNDFKVEIIAKKFLKLDKEKGESQKINGVISNSILRVLDIKTTQVDVKVDKDKIVTKLIDRGSLIYHIEEPNKHGSLINDVKINLYFLNRSAKVNFGKIMDIEPVNYGNVFLFKNGFRVQPYGDVGDDSWEIDRRKQQGYNRFLGTRDLFGKVDLITENFNEFKEVSSRDGGLVETLGKKVLFELFYEKALKRLERYVVGVLWGEAFKRKSYFINDDIAEGVRTSLKDDKDKDTYEDIKLNVGSKIDFVNLIKSLSDDVEVKIVAYDNDLVDFVNEQLDYVQPKFMHELEKIAERTNDHNLLNKIRITEDSFNRILKEKNEAEKREEEEREKRVEAERKAKNEEQKRKNAERKAYEEELKRKEAELQAKNRENERIRAENERLKAENLAREEAEKRKAEQELNKKLNDKLSIESKKNQYLNATRKTLSDDAEQLVHSIDLYVGNASTYINELLIDDTLDYKTKDNLYYIKKHIDKALKVSQIIIKSNFDYKHTSQRIDLTRYITEYLQDLSLTKRDLKIEPSGTVAHFSFLNPIDIDIVLDNLVSNSIKAKAKKILVEFTKESSSKSVIMKYFDDGIGMPEKLVDNPDSIFELGVRESLEKGSGIGMYDAKKRMRDIKGDIEFIGNGIKLKGASFKLTFK
ncbi:ATP-binding protein [Chitinophaga oryzae]|uniref:ATP-binding protein n=1 Tax=Chitinophaga oryzae TaxID=2725414 RepID=A0AAE7DBS8_9BACT|nr:ATP-binding protein [Chitinophaga oryzae]QJB35929.1 ATP-binding protein [Chitinophaga oryzae]